LAKTTEGTTEEYKLNGVVLYRKMKHIPYINKKYYPHIAGYVQNYTEIRLEQFVLEHNIDCKDIIRVWVDGIYLNTKITLNQKFMNDFHENKKHIVSFNTNMEYKCEEPIYFSYKFDDRALAGNLIVKGNAGCGKSYLLRNLYSQIPNSIVLVPTNELIKQYPSCKCVTLDYFIHNKKDFGDYTDTLLDEYSMISQEKIDKLLENENIRRIILFGDTNQLGLVEGRVIDESKYNILILEKNYRQHNEHFQKKLNQLRVSGKFDFKQKIDAKEALNKQFIILSSTHDDIDKLNKMGLVLNNNELINGLKIGAPIRFYKTVKYKDGKNGYNAGEMGKIVNIDDENISIKKDNDEIVQIKRTIFDKYHKLAYSVTYHAIQGKTIHDQNIAINTNKLFDTNMLYVGCSRVIDEEQLYMLVEWK